MDQSQIDAFREQARLALIERIALRALLLAPVIGPGLSMKESAETLQGWLGVNSAKADREFGGHFQDPGLAALFSEELKSVTDEMKKAVGEMADEWTASGAQ